MLFYGHDSCLISFAKARPSSERWGRLVDRLPLRDCDDD